jgi:hypothetical protein
MIYDLFDGPEDVKARREAVEASVGRFADEVNGALNKVRSGRDSLRDVFARASGKRLGEDVARVLDEAIAKVQQLQEEAVSPARATINMLRAIEHSYNEPAQTVSEQAGAGQEAGESAGETSPQAGGGTTETGPAGGGKPDGPAADTGPPSGGQT